MRGQYVVIDDFHHFLHLDGEESSVGFGCGGVMSKFIQSLLPVGWTFSFVGDDEEEKVRVSLVYSLSSINDHGVCFSVSPIFGSTCLLLSQFTVQFIMLISFPVEFG